MSIDQLRVEVVYAAPDAEHALRLEVPAGTSIRGAVERSRLLETLPAALAATCCFGIFGVVQPAETPVQDGDRIEIYRPLPDDPKSIRRRRASRRRAGMGSGRPP